MYQTNDMNQVPDTEEESYTAIDEQINVEKETEQRNEMEDIELPGRSFVL